MRMRASDVESIFFWKAFLVIDAKVLFVNNTKQRMYNVSSNPSRPDTRDHIRAGRSHVACLDEGQFDPSPAHWLDVIRSSRAVIENEAHCTVDWTNRFLEESVMSNSCHATRSRGNQCLL